MFCWLVVANPQNHTISCSVVQAFFQNPFSLFSCFLRAVQKKEPLPYGNGSFNNSWAEVDSNHRSNLQQIYSLSPLATRESAHLSMCPDRGKLYHSLSRYASYKFKKCYLFSINARKTKGFPGVAVHSGNQSFLYIRIPYNMPSLITS